MVRSKLRKIKTQHKPFYLCSINHIEEWAKITWLHHVILPVYFWFSDELATVGLVITYRWLVVFVIEYLSCNLFFKQFFLNVLSACWNFDLAWKKMLPHKLRNDRDCYVWWTVCFHGSYYFHFFPPFFFFSKTWRRQLPVCICGILIYYFGCEDLRKSFKKLHNFVSICGVVVVIFWAISHEGAFIRTAPFPYRCVIHLLL